MNISHIEQNYLMLIERQHGEKLYVVEGRLMKMDFIKRVFFFFSASYRNSVHAGLKQAISEVIKNPKLNTIDLSSLTKLFFDKLAPLKDTAYDRSAIPSAILESLQNEMGNEAGDVTEQYKTALKSARFALRLGLCPTKGDGVSSSYILKNVEGRAVGIFKPSIGETYSFSHPSRLRRARLVCIKILRLTRTLFKTVGGQGYLAEAATYLVDKEIGTGLVKETAVTKLNISGKLLVGSFQLFETREFKVATDFFKITHRYRRDEDSMPEEEMLKRVGKEHFDKLVVLDFITGNMDRHAENWFIVPDGNDNALDLVAIDGGMSFAPNHSDTFLERKKQYLWKRMPHADAPFSESGKALIDRVYHKRDALITSITRLYHENEADTRVTKLRTERMLERIEVLKRYADTGKTKAELAEVYSTNAVNEALANMS